MVKEDANHKNMEIGKKNRSFLLALKKIPHENLAIFKVKNPFNEESTSGILVILGRKIFAKKKPVDRKVLQRC
mgnify:CR=1 FL=1